MKAQAKPKYETIDVPLAQCRGSREAKATNSTVQSVLRKKTCAEVIYYAIPDKKSNVFCRRITLAKVDRAELGIDNDHPDMDDLYDTELPWTGLVSFEGSSRQFRAQYALKVYVQITRMYGDVLYLFAEGAFPNDDVTPVLINVEKNNLVASHLKLTIIDDTPEMAINAMIPAKFPKALTDDMRNAGYEWKGDRFVGIDPTKPYSEILCRPYGKLLQPLNGN